MIDPLLNTHYSLLPTQYPFLNTLNLTSPPYIHAMKKWLFLFALFPTFISAQWELSPGADIRIVTCGPYQGELYSAFGHSAIRVRDSAQGLDLIYNYGVFNFNQPNFYLNFARGHLLYRLAVMDYRPFVDSYIEENRFVHEQILNLNPRQEQRLFDFLQWNALPENMEYNYDYFYDNCATRVRDAVKTTFGDTISFDGSYITTSYTIRDLCDIYLQQQPWGDLGIDLCLGLPMDKRATPWMYMFLPDYVESAFENATISDSNGVRPLVAKNVVTFKGTSQKVETSWNTPLFWLSMLLAIGLLFTFLGIRRGKPIYVFDIILFSITGLLGWFLLVLWVGTDHSAAAGNLNLLWAILLYFPLALFLLKRSKPEFLKGFFGLTALINLITLAFWWLLPQDLNTDLAPLILLLGIRSFYLYRNLPGFEN